MRLRNIRRKLEAGQRRYTKRKISCNTEPGLEQDQGDSSVTSEWITLMKRLRPSAENTPSIKSAMEKTYAMRRSWISKESPTVAEIFNEYPRFLDMPSLMDLEFGKMTDGKTDLFIRRWEASIIPKLKAVAAMEKSDVAALTAGMEDQTDDGKCYTMLVVLTHLLPPLPGSRCSVKSAISFLLDFAPPGTSIASLFSNPEMASKTQPLLICMGNLKSTTRQYIIIARNDKVTVPVDGGLTCALDKLFKLYWVCNLAYPPQLSSVFTFFEYIYDVTISTNRRAKVLELISKLQASQ
ncbi:uncharacterized protein LOC121517115 [Cheilinus undulatus]|uniref:uncharacterized protein LOC121517115 n=1 Tax=Cheilinus undulatus TaxID=241271 RepID=UPI001BD26346|nr:uncharacterized protein LOC121517115 [Cheilinus undulatus]